MINNLEKVDENEMYTDINELPLAITVNMLADILDVGMNTAYALVHSGKIKSVRVGSQIRISKNSLAEYLGMAC